MSDEAKDWRAMPAGRDLDAIVAERVMGLVPGRDFGDWPEHDWQRNKDGTVDFFASEADHYNGPMCARCYYSYCEHCQDGPTQPCHVEPHRYSTSIALAWGVLSALNERGLRVTVDQDWHMQFLAYVHRGKEFVCQSAWYDTAPLAICHAALAAMPHAQ